MTGTEPENAASDHDQARAGVAASTLVASWRYIGDRAAADSAYCTRFSVTHAPEPQVAVGGVWAYALPTTGAS